MKNYFKMKNIEFSVLVFIGFLSMSLFFQIIDENIQELVKNKDMYLSYVGGLFIFYIYLSIQSRKNYINYFKENKKTYYQNIDGKYKKSIVIHKYFPLFIGAIVFASQIKLNYEEYLIWFYFLVSLMFGLLITMIKFSKKIIKEEKEK